MWSLATMTGWLDNANNNIAKRFLQRSYIDRVSGVRLGKEGTFLFLHSISKQIIILYIFFLIDWKSSSNSTHLTYPPGRTWSLGTAAASPGRRWGCVNTPPTSYTTRHRSPDKKKIYRVKCTGDTGVSSRLVKFWAKEHQPWADRPELLELERMDWEKFR